ncbi:SH3 domain-containing protein [Sphingomonas sp.]|uniref:SH3 domain-containing protein n=1 Tax=Sphingomonas sp. TaxID=28214 RepID=UPI003CC6232A
MRRLALLLLLAAPAPAAELADGRSGLPTPRFVSIKPARAYLRTGPGDKYPISFVYVRAGLPVEVLREWEIWRQVRDIDGTIGWMNKNLLSGERHAVVTKDVRTLYGSADLQARPVWRIEPGAVVGVVLCDAAWCRVTRDGKGGYILRSQLWGVYPGEAIGS